MVLDLAKGEKNYVMIMAFLKKCAKNDFIYLNRFIILLHPFLTKPSLS